MRALLWSVVAAGSLSGCVMGGPYADGYPGGYDPYGGQGGAYGGAQQVRCESTDGRVRHCPLDTSRGAYLVRQLSGSSCVRGRTWDVDRYGVWVNGGCRADFASGGGYGGYGNYGNYRGQGDGQVVRCESTDGRFRICPADTRGGMTLVRQLSGSGCIQGQTWGWDQRGVWVDRGCRADFQTGGGWNGGYPPGGYGPGGYPGGGYPGGYGGSPRTVRCESNDGRPHRCDTPVHHAVLQRQLSNSRCIERQTWGWDPGGVWVTAGCRADFSVW